MTFLLFEYFNNAVKQNTKRVFDKRHAPIYKINTFSQQSIQRRNKIYTDTKLTFFVCLFGPFFKSLFQILALQIRWFPVLLMGVAMGFTRIRILPLRKKRILIRPYNKNGSGPDLISKNGS